MSLISSIPLTFKTNLETEHASVNNDDTLEKLLKSKEANKLLYTVQIKIIPLTTLFHKQNGLLFLKTNGIKYT